MAIVLRCGGRPLAHLSITPGHPSKASVRVLEPGPPLMRATGVSANLALPAPQTKPKAPGALLAAKNSPPKGAPSTPTSSASHRPRRSFSRSSQRAAQAPGRALLSSNSTMSLQRPLHSPPKAEHSLFVPQKEQHPSPPRETLTQKPKAIPGYRGLLRGAQHYYCLLYPSDPADE